MRLIKHVVNYVSVASFLDKRPMLVIEISEHDCQKFYIFGIPLDVKEVTGLLVVLYDETYRKRDYQKWSNLFRIQELTPNHIELDININKYVGQINLTPKSTPDIPGTIQIDLVNALYTAVLFDLDIYATNKLFKYIQENPFQNMYQKSFSQTLYDMRIEEMFKA